MQIKFLFFVLVLFFCRGKDDQKQRDIENQFILNYLRNQNVSSSPVVNACNNFILIESTCITLSDGQSVSCSSNEIDRVKINIEPTANRTDIILTAFYNCWKSCAAVYNTNDSVCNSSKYATTKTYRETVKSGKNSASTLWGSCMTKCNGGQSEEEGLKGTGSTYTGQPY